MAAYSGAMKNRYARAASRPWSVLGPDPPPPDPWSRVPFWLARRDYGRALADLEELARRHPEDPYPHKTRAWVWATCTDAKYRNGKRAVESATRACELSGWKEPASLDALAAAYAESGDFEAAISRQTEALDRVPPNSRRRPGYKARLALYQQGKPYREEPAAE